MGYSHEPGRAGEESGKQIINDGISGTKGGRKKVKKRGRWSGGGTEGRKEGKEGRGGEGREGELVENL